MTDNGNVWTITLTRTLSTTLITSTDKEGAEEIAWKDAKEQGLMKDDEIADDQWKIEASLGTALSWREDD